MADYLNPKKRQKQIKMELSIIDVEDWHQLFPAKLDFSSVTSGQVGKMDIDAALAFMTEANQVSPELTLIGQLIWHQGCEVEELVVEGCDPKQVPWGKMTYIKDHPRYKEPLEDRFEAHFRMDWHRAMFMTEKAGEQHFCLYSTALQGTIHKSLVFHKVVLRPSVPKMEAQPV